MRPGLGRSLSPPRRLGGWGDPLGTISKRGRASSHDGDNRALTSPLCDALLGVTTTLLR